MSTKLEYLKRCLSEPLAVENKRWYVGLFASLLPSSAQQVGHLELVRRPQGLHYALSGEEGYEEVPLTDAKLGEALFHPTDPVDIDTTWLGSVHSKMATTVGRLLLNAAVLYPSLGARLDYVNTPLKVTALEAMLAERIVDDGEVVDANIDISVAQYLDCMDRLWFLTKLSNLITVAATAHTVLPPPGIDALRAKLLKEHAGNLSDPVVVATVIDELNKHDKAFLAQDPHARHIMDRKGTTARKKLFHMYGETNDFVTSLASDPVTGTMAQGVDTDEKVFPKYVNDLRYASYSRGHSTQLSGYSYKILQRSLSGLEIAQEPCNTQRGLLRTITQPAKLVNRYVRVGKGWQLIQRAKDAQVYLGKAIEVRSPMYCTTAGNAVCYHCLGENYKGNKNAINNIAAGYSGELMSLFLKRMHTSGFNLTDVHLKDLAA